MLLKKADGCCFTNRTAWCCWIRLERAHSPLFDMKCAKRPNAHARQLCEFPVRGQRSPLLRNDNNPPCWLCWDVFILSVPESNVLKSKASQEGFDAGSEDFNQRPSSPSFQRNTLTSVLYLITQLAVSTLKSRFAGQIQYTSAHLLPNWSPISRLIISFGLRVIGIHVNSVNDKFALIKANEVIYSEAGAIDIHETELICNKDINSHQRGGCDLFRCDARPLISTKVLLPAGGQDASICLKRRSNVTTHNS